MFLHNASFLLTLLYLDYNSNNCLSSLTSRVDDYLLIGMSLLFGIFFISIIL